jgi:hypothetical protein
MSSPERLSLVGSSDMPDYPISADERLDSHYFVQWNLKRWRGSDFRKKAYADPEVGFYRFELICLAQDETPVGTLPTDETYLAFTLHMPLERWQSLMRRDVTPLDGWHTVMCDNDEVRLTHPVVQAVAVEAMKSKRTAAAKAVARANAKRLKDLREKIEALGAGRVLQQPNVLERLDEWLTENHSGNRMEAAVRAAMDAVLV